MSTAERAESLWAAANKGRDAEVRARLRAGDDVNKADTHGYTALIFSAASGHERVVQTLCEANAAVDHVAAADGRTALMCASSHGNGNVIAVLLHAGASINLAAPSGATALLFACCGGHSDAVTALLAAGADVEPASAPAGITPMMVAIQNRHRRIVQLLSSYLAKRTVEIGPARTPVTAEYFAGTNSTAAIAEWLRESRQWSTPLHHLTIIDAGRARALLRDGADLHARTDALEAPTPLSLEYRNLGSRTFRY